MHQRDILVFDISKVNNSHMFKNKDIAMYLQCKTEYNNTVTLFIGKFNSQQK